MRERMGSIRDQDPPLTRLGSGRIMLCESVSARVLCDRVRAGVLWGWIGAVGWANGRWRWVGLLPGFGAAVDFHVVALAVEDVVDGAVNFVLLPEPAGATVFGPFRSVARF